jgi:hypothetical protein
MHTNGYFNHDQVSWLLELERVLAGVNANIVFFKYLKLTRINMRMSVSIHVLKAAKRPLTSWIVVTCLLYFAFSLMGYLLFGSTLECYSTISRTSETLLGYIIGQYRQTSSTDITYQSGYKALRYAGMDRQSVFGEPFVFFMLFNITFFFLLIKLLISVIALAYAAVSVEIIREHDLSQEQAQLRIQAEHQTKSTWHQGILGSFYRMFNYQEEQRIIDCLATDPLGRKQGYLNYKQLCTALAKGGNSREHVVPPHRIAATVRRLLSLQRVDLRRSKDIMAIFKQEEVRELSLDERGNDEGFEMKEDVANDFSKLHRNDSESKDLDLEKGAEVADIDMKDGNDDEGMGDDDQAGLEMVTLETGTSTKEAEKRKREHQLALENSLKQSAWDRDTVSGEVIHSMVYVMCSGLEDDGKKVHQLCRAIDTVQRELIVQILNIESRLNKAQLYFTGKSPNSEAFDTPEGKEIWDKYQESLKERQKTNNSDDEDDDIDEDEDGIDEDEE